MFKHSVHEGHGFQLLLINNPGALYGAATKSVIRITTKTRKEDSWGVDMSSSYGINEEKFNRPVICFIDTPGAYCGLGAEERGQGEAIAKNLYEMSSLTVPVLSIVTGEGGSGGALALGVANEVWMMENSIYSILSPEGFASILWKDSKKAKEAAEIMKLTAADLYELGIIEKVIPEYPVINENNIKRVTLYMKRMICDFMYRYIDMDKEELARQRSDRGRLRPGRKRKSKWPD